MASYSCVDDVFEKVINGSLCLLKNKDKFVYRFNETASYLWKLLKKQQSQEDLIKALSSKYKIPLSQAQKDVEDFLKYYLSENLIKKVSD
jgi:hypothetical protein